MPKIEVLGENNHTQLQLNGISTRWIRSFIIWLRYYASSDWLVYRSITYGMDRKFYRPAISQVYSHIINILLTSFAWSVPQVMDPRFFPLFMARALHAWAIRRGKNSVHNLRYGPCTRLIRGMNYLCQKRKHNCFPGNYKG